MKAKKHNKPWTVADLRKLRAKARQRASSREAAAVLGRTPEATRYKAMVEGVRFCKVEQPRGIQKTLARRRKRFGMHATLKRAA